MISKDDVTKALDAAAGALLNKRDLSWIRNSCRTEQAYFLGLLSGLESIAAEADLGTLIFLTSAVTANNRRGDDTFPSTKIGQEFELLKKHLHEHLEHLQKHRSGGTSASDPLTPESTRGLSDAVGQARAYFQEALKTIDAILSEIPFHDPMHQVTVEEQRSRENLVYDMEWRLGHSLRFVALLETSHEMSKRLES